MIRRYLILTAGIAAGHALAAALFWALVNIPDSSVPMLALSGLTAVAVVFVVGFVQVAALAAGSADGGWTQPLATGLRRWPAALVGLAIVAAAWWVTGASLAWHADHRGEIDAWILVNLSTSRTGWLHQTIGAALGLVRYPLAVAVALGAMAAVVLHGWPAVLRGRWVRASCGWRSLAVATAVFVACVWGPWQIVAWRPRGLPPTWVEPTVAGARLLALYAWATAGWTWLIVSTARRLDSTPSTPPSPAATS